MHVELGPDGDGDGCGIAAHSDRRNDRATYACVIVAMEGGRVLGTSAVVIIGPFSAGTLPAAGAGSASTAGTAVVLTLLGALLAVTVRRPRRADR